MTTSTRALFGGAPSTSKPNVVVVGAGFSGLAAARRLLTKTNGNCNVVILEADSRVGGRACTLQLDNTGVGFELGATWIHGLGSVDNPNPVLQAAIDGGIMTQRPEAMEWWDSTYVIPGRSEPLTKQEEILIHTTTESYRGVIDSLSPSDKGSVLEYLNQALKEVLEGTNSPEERELALAAWRWRDGLQAAISGSPSFDQDAAGLAMYTEFGGTEAHATIPGGFQGVAESMARGLDIRLGHHVDSIEWNNFKKVTLNCRNGQEFKADAALVTVSLGVLKKRHKTLFNPPLPAEKAAAIKKLKIGIVDKICVDFSQQEEEHDEDIVHDTGALQAYSLLWVDHDSEALNAKVPEWAQGIYAIRFGGPEFKVPPKRKSGARKHLVVWITGREALMMERLSDEEVMQGLQAVFDAFPGLKLPDGASWSRCKVYRSDWALNPLTHGSYSYIAAGSTPADVAALKAPLVASNWKGDSRKVVMFGGEACSVEYIGAVHGAMITGVEAADEIIESLSDPAVRKLDKGLVASS